MTARKPWSRRWARLAATLLASTATAAVFVPTPANAATATTRTVRVCHTQTLWIFNADVYTVCLTARDTYDGSHVTGYAGTYCNVYLPTGVGWWCSTQRSGSYWNAARGAWEDWVNYRLEYASPDHVGADCIYLRVDTKPTGATSYQNFANTTLVPWVTC